MLTYKKIFPAFFCLLFIGHLHAAAVEFNESSFPAVKQSAQINNRPYLAYFTAKWCMPCRMMDESTWLDPGLAWYMKQNYYAAKIDVEDFDGYALADQYKVQAYPTIILFAPDGKMLKRIEGSVTGSKLLQYLKEYDAYEDPPAPGPDEITTTAPSPIVTEPHTPAPGYKLPPTETEPDYAPGYRPPLNKNITNGTGLFIFNVERAPAEGYGVQVGVYADYENVLREVAVYQEQFKETVLVHIAKLDGRTVYKVLIGDFNKRDKAEKMKAEILAAGLPDAFVKDLSTVK